VRRVLIAVAATATATATAATGCGSATPKPTPTPTRTADQRQVADLAQAFVQSVGRHDWASACAARSYDDHVALAEQAGTCERAMQQAFAGKDVALLARTVAGRVVVDKDAAAVDMVQRGAARTRLRLFAIREGGAWKLQNPPS
jgi:hypothetical protein